VTTSRTGPRIGLALGGGGARGLAHIAMIEVFDELGLKPAVIAGTSMGAIIGAAYASGLEARAIRDHAERVLANRTQLARLLFNPGENHGVFDLIEFKLFGPMMVNGETLARVVFPPGVADFVEATAIPLKVIATDFFGRREVLIENGPMGAAVAASIAIPGMISSPKIGGRVMVDGGITNPVPFDHVQAASDIVVAIDVIGGPVERRAKGPSNLDLALGGSQILMRQIARLMRERSAPDIYIEPLLDRFRVLEFFRADEILAAAAPAKDDLKRQLEAQLAKAS
jgi:NTE family protein